MAGDNIEMPISNNQSDIKDLSDFELKRVINTNRYTKTICVEGTFRNKVGAALLLLEKTLTNFKTVKDFLSDNSNYTLKKIEDDTYECIPHGEVGSIKVTLIFPATERHIKKYEVSPFHEIKETAELYYNVTLPCITEASFNIQWVYNILSHEAEQESIVYEDSDPNIGFMFLPDLKWNQKRMENLYMIAIIKRRNIKSLRDLTAEHLPLLHNIRKKGVQVIKDKYGLNEYQLRIYIHYQPSYYHLHVHFSHIEFGAPGISAFKSHLLDTVINNIEMVSDYYQRAVLSFTIKESDRLFLKFKEKGIVKETSQSKDDEKLLTKVETSLTQIPDEKV